MKIENDTKNQHYLSQVEQRLNSFNPDEKKRKQKIYTFNIIDREDYKITLLSEEGSLIDNNLSLGDLFSFDVVDKKIRANLETLFHAYECDIGTYTHTLLEKLQRGNNDI